MHEDCLYCLRRWNLRAIYLGIYVLSILEFTCYLSQASSLGVRHVSVQSASRKNSMDSRSTPSKIKPQGERVPGRTHKRCHCVFMQNHRHDALPCTGQRGQSSSVGAGFVGKCWPVCASKQRTRPSEVIKFPPQTANCDTPVGCRVYDFIPTPLRRSNCLTRPWLVPVYSTPPPSSRHRTAPVSPPYEAMGCPVSTSHDLVIPSVEP